MIEIKGLSIVDKYKNKILSDVSINILEKRITALTGPSGSGKTTLINAIIGILNEDLLISSGGIYVNGQNINEITKEKRRNLSGKKLAFIPQLPMRAFNERMKIGKQMTELYISNLKVDKSKAVEMAERNLNFVNLESKRILSSYPYELSGGMLQRVIIAIVLGLSPDYIVADEPTAALDDYNASLFFDLIEKNFKDKGILLVTHDIDIIIKKSNYCYVMHQGKVIEEGENSVFKNPRESWTKKIVELCKKEKSLEDYWEWNKLN